MLKVCLFDIKHVDIKAKFIREKMQVKSLQLGYISTSEMLADGLTKAIPAVKNEGLPPAGNFRPAFCRR